MPQRASVLGIELLAAAVLSGTLLLVLDRNAQHFQTTTAGTASLINRTVLAVIVAAVALSGLLVVSGQGWGRYFYVASAIAALLWGVYGAWAFVTEPLTTSTDPT